MSLDTLVFGTAHEAQVDTTEFVFDPKHNRYVRRFGRMNFWDLSCWLLVGRAGRTLYHWLILYILVRTVKNESGTKG